MNLTRRQVLKTTTALASIPFLGNWSENAAYRHIVAKVTGGEARLPSDKYIPFDWQFSEIAPITEGVKLTWKDGKISKNSNIRLRLTSATDVREELILEVKTAVSGKKIADWDMRFAAYMQPFDLIIETHDAEAVFTEGVILTMKRGTKPFWFFTNKGDKNTAPTAYQPHLLVYEKADTQAWQHRLLSQESVQTFGWQQGIVWDGLFEMSRYSATAKKVLAQQMDLYLGNDSLVYAKYNNIKETDTINNVESILPFAILAQTHPTHRLLKTAIAFCEKHANTEGVIADDKGDNRLVKTEECYTVSYPLAVLATTLNRPDLANLAIKTLQSRINLLEKGDSIYQRGTEKGALFFENWTRGTAWYFLGLAKTLVHLPESKEKEAIKRVFQKSVEKVVKHQQANGLWFNFFHQPETGLETSGTAGIAAALNYAIKHHLLSKKYQKVVAAAEAGLLPHLTPDGYLTGTAQVNKAEGGSSLQLNGFRVISPYTLGFLAHFRAT